MDRSTLQTTEAPAGVKVEPATGLTVSFPLHPAKDSSYQLWDSLTQRTGVAKFEGTKTVNGRTANVNSTTVTSAVADQHTLASLPAALPKQLVAGLVPMLPKNAAAQLSAALPTLPDMVPMTYTGVTQVQAEVDSQTGVALDQHLVQSVISGVTVGGATTSIAPVMSVDASLTPASQAKMHDEAASAGRALTILGIVPIALLVLGGGLVVAGVVVGRRAGKAAPVSGPADVQTARELVDSTQR